MGSLVLLVVAAVWVAVLVPPLVRSRLENRPNSSVSDFRAQLSSLQRAVPSSRTAVSMRPMARPLAPSPLARPAATGRPPLRSGVSLAGGGSLRSAGQQAAMRPERLETARTFDPSLRARTHGDGPTRTHARPALPAAAGRDDVRRRRANVLFVLAIVAACAVFLAVTTKSPGMSYAAVAACIAVAAYLSVLAQAAARAAPARTRARRPAPSARREDPPVRRRREPADARPVLDGPPASQRYRGARAEQPAPPARRPRVAEWDEPAPRQPRREHRSQAVPRVRDDRPVRRREPREPREDWGYDPRPSGLVYGEPALYGQQRPRRAVDRSPAV